MPRKTSRERPYREFAENPFVAAAWFGISATIVGLSYAVLTATPERRRALRERMEAERRQQDKEKEQRSLLHRLRKEYFEQGGGNALYRRQAYVVVPRGRPPADAWFKTADGGRGFRAGSESAGLRLGLSHDFRDAMTSVSMTWPGHDHYYALGGIIDGALMIYPADLTEPSRFERWVEGAERMAGLIAAPGSTVDTIRLRRPDHASINRRLWDDYLRRNPDLAAATGEAWRFRDPGR